ncbi:MAG: ABC transporter ATP-binding protein/permease [Alphaproteobacteria bacterium]|nr:ABC transporter ATP-binding protein/permease [Alphaproteobacteria bacterium]
MTRSYQSIFRQFVLPYWMSEQRWSATVLLAVIVSLSLSNVYISVLFNAWNGTFYNALEARDLDAFYYQLAVFCGLATAAIIVAVYQIYLRQMLRIRWRTWLTNRLIDEWLEYGAYYNLQVHGARTDNPDQRIAEDVDQFIMHTITLTLGLLESVVTLVSFTTILWGLSGTLEVPIFDTIVAVPGYMVWFALIYAIAGTYLTQRIGRPLVTLNYMQQRYEADFRFSLIRFRENAEGVALYRGETDEKLVFGDRFAHVARNWWNIMRAQKRLTWLTAGYTQAAIVFPFLAAAPRYFSGQLQLGGLMQTSQAFTQVQGALSWFIDAYTTLALWKATVNRLTTFRASLEDFHEQRRTTNGISVVDGKGDELVVSDVDLNLPDGDRLIKALKFSVKPGESVLITGASGSGKSTLFRAIAQLWRFGQGTIELPHSGQVLFLPQKPYLPIGSLRAAVCYPSPTDDFAEEEVVETVTICGLAHLVDQIDEVHYWAQTLSLGEQQRVAFARVLLHRPAWLFLDEATSALDEETEAAMYKLVRERLPEAAIVSIGHRSSLFELHARTITLVREPMPKKEKRPLPAEQMPSSSRLRRIAGRVYAALSQSRARMSGRRDTPTPA